MNYKFQIGELVMVRDSDSLSFLLGELVKGECDYLGLVTDRMTGPGSSAAVAGIRF